MVTVCGENAHRDGSTQEGLFERPPRKLEVISRNDLPLFLNSCGGDDPRLLNCLASQVSSGSARAPEPSSGSGVIDFRSDASELPAIARRLHVLLKGSNNQIYSSRELFRSR